MNLFFADSLTEQPTKLIYNLIDKDLCKKQVLFSVKGSIELE